MQCKLPPAPYSAASLSQPMQKRYWRQPYYFQKITSILVHEAVIEQGMGVPSTRIDVIWGAHFDRQADIPGASGSIAFLSRLRTTTDTARGERKPSQSHTCTHARMRPHYSIRKSNSGGEA